MVETGENLMRMMQPLSTGIRWSIVASAVLSAAVMAMTFSCCSKPEPPGYRAEIEAHRATLDSSMRFDSDSPFHRDSSVHFHGLRWYPSTYEFRCEALLHKSAAPVLMTIRGTKGEQRQVIRYGNLSFQFRGKEYRLNVYKFTDEELQKRGDDLRSYLMVWFTDKTTGSETYPVGRYVDIDRESPNPNHIYVLDFNKAYNPYCAYSSMYSCAVPTRDDVLDFAVTAGEKKYHN
jgi:hypothetical protein